MQDVSIKEEKKSVLELFADFYQTMRGTEPDEKQMSVMEKIIKAAGGERE